MLSPVTTGVSAWPIHMPPHDPELTGMPCTPVPSIGSHATVPLLPDFDIAATSMSERHADLVARHLQSRPGQPVDKQRHDHMSDLRGGRRRRHDYLYKQHGQQLADPEFQRQCDSRSDCPTRRADRRDGILPGPQHAIAATQRQPRWRCRAKVHRRAVFPSVGLELRWQCFHPILCPADCQDGYLPGDFELSKQLRGGRYEHDEHDCLEGHGIAI